MYDDTNHSNTYAALHERGGDEMPPWVKSPDDWELYEKDMEEVTRYWQSEWAATFDAEHSA